MAHHLSSELPFHYCGPHFSTYRSIAPHYMLLLFASCECGPPLIAFSTWLWSLLIVQNKTMLLLSLFYLLVVPFDLFTAQIAIDGGVLHYNIPSWGVLTTQPEKRDVGEEIDVWYPTNIHYIFMAKN